jgi:hypothetical protein
MDKSTKEIAQYLLDRHNLSPIIMETALKKSLGQAGFKTAYQKRWIEIDPIQGFITISSHVSKLDEMRKEAAAPDKEAPAQIRISEHSARDLIGIGVSQASNHDVSRLNESQDKAKEVYDGPPKFWKSFVFPQSREPIRPVVEELPVVSAPRASTTPPTRPSTTGNSEEESPEIGDTVVLASGGKSYEAVVQASSDGKFKLSFGGERPSETRDFTREELKVLKKAALQQ